METLCYQAGLARCGLDAYRLPDGRWAILLSELADNPGRSVTNAVEELASWCAAMVEASRERLMIVERYERSQTRGGETFDEVSFTWRGLSASDPVWTPRDRAWWEELTAHAERRLLLG